MLTYECMNRFLDDVRWIKAKRNEHKCKSHTCTACPSSSYLMNMFVSIVSGATAGVMSWALVIPFDVMKTIMQAQSDPKKHRNLRKLIRTKRDVSGFVFRSEYGVFNDTTFSVYNLQKYGWRVFYRGSWILVMRSIPVNAVTFLGKIQIPVDSTFGSKTNRRYFLSISQDTSTH